MKSSGLGEVVRVAVAADGGRTDRYTNDLW
jgi:hypothetical protein